MSLRSIPTSIDGSQPSQSGPLAPRGCSHRALDAQVAFCNPTKFAKRWVNAAVRGTAVEAPRPKKPDKREFAARLRTGPERPHHSLPEPSNKQALALGRTTFEETALHSYRCLPLGWDRRTHRQRQEAERSTFVILIYASALSVSYATRKLSAVDRRLDHRNFVIGKRL